MQFDFLFDLLTIIIFDFEIANVTDTMIIKKLLLLLMLLMLLFGKKINARGGGLFN